MVDVGRKLTIALLGLAVALPSEAEAFQQKSDTFDYLVGTWEGELEYLDYGDDSTLVSLPTRLVCTRSESSEGLLLQFSFEEPNGRVVTSRERFYEDAEGLHMDGLWQIEERFAGPDGAHRLVLNQRGEDNGRPANVRTTIVAERALLTITKFVTYVDSAQPIQRHQYRFERVP